MSDDTTEHFPRFDDSDTPVYEWPCSGVSYDPNDHRFPILVAPDCNWMSLAEARGLLMDLQQAIQMAEESPCERKLRSRSG